LTRSLNHLDNHWSCFSSACVMKQEITRQDLPVRVGWLCLFLSHLEREKGAPAGRESHQPSVIGLLRVPWHGSFLGGGKAFHSLP
jgi:hypothetical protein